MAEANLGGDIPKVWYFAYGSNMSDLVMTRRGVRPMRTHNAVAPSHRLIFDVYGVPFSEPAMASIEDRPPDAEDPPAHGVAYLLTETDYVRILVSEGAGIGYREIGIRIHEVAAAGNRTPKSGPMMMDARTLVARFPFKPSALPSVRYLVS
jgi:hypothetical protein